MRVIVIGGGASGLTAAIAASKEGAEVTIIEHMPRIGKKILLTGSGKCNISNFDMSLTHFHSGNCKIVESVLDECSPQMTLDFLRELGLITKNKNGYLYPYSEQASSVLDVLRFAVRDMNIETIYSCNTKKIIYKNSSSFEVYTDKGIFEAERIILCCGSKAYPETGSDGSGYILAKELGHPVIKPLSALTFLNCEEDFYPSVAGIRTKAAINAYADGNSFEETGELQITKTGISGIPVFNLSSFAAKEYEKGNKVEVCIDFVPDIDDGLLFSVFDTRVKDFPQRTLEELFCGILHKNLGMCILKRLGIKLTRTFESLSFGDIKIIVAGTKYFKTMTVSAGGFEKSQICSGGIDLNYVSEKLESQIVPGMFFAGEILDVNGDCGGYNLTWAFSSGIVAGRSCVKCSR